MSHTNALDEPVPSHHYIVQLHAVNDPPPSGRFAVERVGRRYGDERVRAEFVLCAPIDFVKRDLRSGDRVHAEQRFRKGTRTLVRRVDVTPNGILLYPLQKARGPKAKPIKADDVAIMGVVFGSYTSYRT